MAQTERFDSKAPQRRPSTRRPASDPGELARDLVRRFEALRQARQPFDEIWAEVSEFMGPAYAGFRDNGRQSLKRRPDLVDSTARRAAGIFAAGMLSGVASPSQRWFRLTLGEGEADMDAGARHWLQQVEDIYYRVLSRCGYYPQQAQGFHQAGLFGWQCLYVDENPAMSEGGLRFQTLPLDEVFIAENARGEVDTVFRRFSLTARQAAQKFGAKSLPETIARALNNRRREEEPFWFLHAVLPRSDRAGQQPGGALAYGSYYVALEGPRLVAQGGYEGLPYVVTRSHRLPGTAYSYSPGTEALADVKMINEMKRLILEAGQLAVAPPYLVPDDGFLGRFSFEPRAMNYYRRAEGNSLADFGPLSVGGDPRFSLDLLASTRQDINEAFYVDLFLTIKQRSGAGAAPTAQEVAELAGERLFLLGPMLINQQQENFQRLFDRLFVLLLRRGELPPLPSSLAGRRPEVDYVSPFMLAQSENQSTTMLKTYADVAQLAGVAPSVLDILDHEQNARRLLRQRGFPQDGIRSPEVVALLRQAAAGEL